MSKSRSNIIWSIIDGFSVQIVQFVITILISRIISPESFGKVAMLAIFIAIAQTLVDSGLSNALIQKQKRTELEFSSVFIFNILISICIYFIIFLISSRVAEFYNISSLKEMLRIQSLSIVISSFTIVHRAILIIEGKYKYLAIISLVASIISGFTALYFAYRGFEAWALVIQYVFNQFIITVLLFIFVKWNFIYSLSFKRILPLLKFGYKILISGLLNVLYVNLYTIVIGKIFSASILGFYSRANTLAQFPSVYLTNYIVRGLYPTQCEYQNDNYKLLLLLRNYVKWSTIIVCPLMIGISVQATSIICLVLTDKWIYASKLLTIISIAYMLRPVMGINEILNAKGRSDLYLKAEIIKKIIAVVLLLLFIPFGVEGLCYSLIIYGLFDSLIIFNYVKKVLPYTFKNLLYDLKESLFLSGVVFLINYLIKINIDNLLYCLLLGVILSILFYCIWIFIIHKEILLRYIKNINIQV